MKATARCVSCNAAARVTAAEQLARDVRGYYDANPGLLLDVSGVDRDAVARNLTQQGVDNVAVVPGGTNEGTVVVAKKAGAEVARFHSITSIVPFVQLPPTLYDRAVKNVQVSMPDTSHTIVMSQLFFLDTNTNTTAPQGTGGVWLSPRAYVYFNIVGGWRAFYFSETPTKTVMNLAIGVSDGSAVITRVPTLQNVQDAADTYSFTSSGWTGDLPSDF